MNAEYFVRDSEREGPIAERKMADITDNIRASARVCIDCNTATAQPFVPGPNFKNTTPGIQAEIERPRIKVVAEEARRLPGPHGGSVPP
jgi:hypothetical protein